MSAEGVFAAIVISMIIFPILIVLFSLVFEDLFDRELLDKIFKVCMVIAGIGVTIFIVVLLIGVALS